MTSEGCGSTGSTKMSMVPLLGHIFSAKRTPPRFSPGLTPSSASRFSGCTETMRGSPSASASRASFTSAAGAHPPPINPATIVPSGRMIALAPALAAVTDTVLTTVARTNVSSAALSRATRSITSTCLVMGVAPSAFASPLPLAGEVDALARARRVGEISPLGQPVLRRHPHPDPPPLAGEGVHFHCGYICHLVSSHLTSQISQIGFKLGQALYRVGGRIEIDMGQCGLDAQGLGRIAFPRHHRIEPDDAAPAFCERPHPAGEQRCVAGLVAVGHDHHARARMQHARGVPAVEGL